MEFGKVEQWEGSLMVRYWERMETGLPERIGMKEQEEAAALAFAAMYRAKVWVVWPWTLSWDGT
jgi:hypothetical protein